MRVVCAFNKGSDLARQRFDAGYSPATEFHLTVGGEYDVHAMALWESGLVIMVVDDTGLPRWQPVELFSIVDRRIPAQWEFGLGDPADVVKALWGYPSLVRDPDHHDSLSELVPNALEVFRSETGRRTDDLS
ncbi:hypothetical protein [Saccharothrix luteola]|uniref:hypothetical protein n=1 Tax=Saccharothrix luteola TaxID=2893018 RepID=UPI001E44119D|nr:hypothetical protein [Saccharothrix luteola]MCC8250036.1 hypothetical protein [Saccharothrix luteola]